MIKRNYVLYEILHLYKFSRFVKIRNTRAKISGECVPQKKGEISRALFHLHLENSG